MTTPHVWREWLPQQTSAPDPVGALARWVACQQRQGCDGCAAPTPGALQEHLIRDHDIDLRRVAVAVDAARSAFARIRIRRSDGGDAGGLW